MTVHNINCPECETSLEIQNAEVGAELDCPECGLTLEVIALDPLELGYVADDDDEEEEGDDEEDD